MTTLTDPATTVREPALLGQTVVLIGGSSGIGLETARAARAEGAEVVLTGRDPDRLERAAADVGAQRRAAFDVHDPEALAAFFRSFSTPVDHVLVTAGGPYYAPFADMDIADASRHVADEVRLTLETARHAAGDDASRWHPAAHGRNRGAQAGRGHRDHCPAHRGPARARRQPRPGARARPRQRHRRRFRGHPALGVAARRRRSTSAASTCGPPCRSTASSTPQDVAALAVHVMVNTALTGATFDIDGGQQLT